MLAVDCAVFVSGTLGPWVSHVLSFTPRESNTGDERGVYRTFVWRLTLRRQKEQYCA